ncbi:hypothetical protein IAT38_003631 [Cryptococcus sp. DSM 104549]
MRHIHPLALIFLLLACVATAFAWTKEDHEIFDLVSALEAAEGKGTTFYTHLKVDASATTAQITKAYRKKSLELHPDKNPGVKDIQERFARLGVIAQILRSPEKRERYNFFHKNGVPRWRGTGYYYSRYRPTLLHTLIFLVALTTGFHRLVMQLNYSKHLARIAYFERAARSAAGVLGSGGLGQPGDKIVVPTQGRRRKVKVPMVEGNDSAGTLELIVNGNEVLLPHDGGSLTPISTLAQPPSLSQTWFPSLILSLTHRAIARLPPSIESSLPAFLQPHQDAHDAEVELQDDEEEEGFTLDTPTPINRASRRDQLQKGRGSRSRTGTPKDSPATTELESDADAQTVDGKKKAGPGKAAAARKRKMAMKK